MPELPCKLEPVPLSRLTLDEIQPSQFYISQKKLAAVQAWFCPSDLSNFAPLPVKLLDGRPVFTDGHTRAFAARSAGLTQVPLVWESDELDWALYRACVRGCLQRGITAIGLLELLPDECYRKLWLGWCRQVLEDKA